MMFCWCSHPATGKAAPTSSSSAHGAARTVARLRHRLNHPSARQMPPKTSGKFMMELNVPKAASPPTTAIATNS